MKKIHFTSRETFIKKGDKKKKNSFKKSVQKLLIYGHSFFIIYLLERYPIIPAIQPARTR